MRISRPQVRGRGFKVWTTAWSLPLLSSLSGCAGTPWGDTLSGSFPTPPVQATVEQEAPQAPKRLEAEPPSGSPSPGATAKTGGTALAPQRSPSSPSPAPGAKPREPQASKASPNPPPCPPLPPPTGSPSGFPRPTLLPRRRG
jgi:hypothetical protein